MILTGFISKTMSVPDVLAGRRNAPAGGPLAALPTIEQGTALMVLGKIDVYLSIYLFFFLISICDG